MANASPVSRSSARSGNSRRHVDEWRRASRSTIEHYDRHAADYLEHTLDHRIGQNYEAFLRALQTARGHRILDLGCGVGRDLLYFRSRGLDATGLDGSKTSADVARELTGCPVLVQDFSSLDLPSNRFDGIFANASLFHVPRACLPDVAGALFKALRRDGVLLASNPRGNDEEGWWGDRYVCLYSYRTWCQSLGGAGLRKLEHYYRPPGLPRRQQDWLVTLWRKSA